LKTEQTVFVNAAVGVLPNFVPGRVQTHDPIVVATIARAGFIPIRRRSRKAANNKPAIGGLLNVQRVVVTGAAERFVPKPISVSIGADDPIIGPAIIWAGFISACARP